MDYKLELIILPVSDVERAKAFYDKLDWRLDVDIKGEDGFRAVHYTPTGSAASIIISNGLTDAAPGSTRGTYLVVDDVEAARADIAARGIEITEVFHEAEGGIPSVKTDGRTPGLAPERASYFSFAIFQDPDGNEFILQEITTRFPGRV
ncbi:catechol 2,3-dioxygenase-like lactoylglutathione lyase family enzyme [Pseudarthrobacter sp. W1I19]|uniref:VOC family protein n=1 Tax=Pseudarthrobacter sp. W1I19 TaxID=3042288 RepID=UPI0027892A4B|nr:VOC family protein [Pseudarthrobacter sp. W1I19]MDQ0921511.1 catechol 2,3-dioxygenase-like lactoylglutathione lyase family enzyme [Pseudarthrobacter sp. W1I19]